MDPLGIRTIVVHSPRRRLLQAPRRDRCRLAPSSHLECQLRQSIAAGEQFVSRIGEVVESSDCEGDQGEEEGGCQECFGGAGKAEECSQRWERSVG